MADTVTITITAWQRVEYTRDIRMSREEWERLDAEINALNWRQQREFLSRYAEERIDVRDNWLDAGDFEDVEIELAPDAEPDSEARDGQ